MSRGQDWYGATACAAVVYIVGLSVEKTLDGDPFNPLALAFSVFLLLLLPILQKLAARKPKERPLHITFPPKRED